MIVCILFKYQILTIHNSLLCTGSNIEIYRISGQIRYTLTTKINLNEEGHCRQTCDEFTETKHFHSAVGNFSEGLTELQLQSQLICTETVYITVNILMKIETFVE